MEMQEFALIQSFFFDSSSSSSSDESDIQNQIDLANGIGHNGQFEKRPRVSNFIETVIYRYSEKEFQENFRMNRTTFNYLLAMLRPHLEGDICGFGKIPIPPEKQLYIALHVLGNSDSYRSVSSRFDVGRATAWRALLRVVKAICKYRSYFIRWPTENEADSSFNRIKEKYGFPKVLESIDGTHIRIPAPKMDAQSYVNRKNVHSIQLQVICNDRLEFIHCFVGLPGSVHDMRVFKYSGVQQRCNDNFYPQNSHLIGDSAYTVQKHVMVPFKDNGHLTMEEIHFNKTLSQARMMVERSIGFLKCRWRCLLDKFLMRRTDLVPYYVLCCCVLHNICSKPEDFLLQLPPVIPHEADKIPEPLLLDKMLYQQGIAKRSDICHFLNNMHPHSMN